MQVKITKQISVNGQVLSTETTYDIPQKDVKKFGLDQETEDVEELIPFIEDKYPQIID